jgi:hypothetical protein
MSITNEELEELCAKLDALDLSETQRSFLDNVLKIAWDCVGSHASLDEEFDGCFEPGEAALIMQYQDSTSDTSITKKIGENSNITRKIHP